MTEFREFNLKQAIRRMWPTKVYSIVALIRAIAPNCKQWRFDQLRGQLVKLVEQGDFPPLGDGLVNGKIGFFGFRFQAAIHQGLRLPLFDRPTSTQELIILLPQLREKLMWHWMPRIDVPDIHPFILGVHLWEMTPKTAKMAAPTRFFPPPQAFCKKRSKAGTQKGASMRFN